MGWEVDKKIVGENREKIDAKVENYKETVEQ